MITGLEIRAEVDDNDLKKLTSFLHKPYRLLINSTKITRIPNGLLQSLKELNCSGCTALTSIDAPKAENLNCQDCTTLTSIVAPNAKVLDLTFCSNLTDACIDKLPKKLTTLDLMGCRLTDACIDKLPKELTTLDLTGCSLTDACIDKLRRRIDIIVT